MNQEYSNIGLCLWLQTKRWSPDRSTVTAAPSLATDLSWLLSVAARPSMQARYPTTGRDVQRTGGPGGSGEELLGRGADETCFTEMQALAHHGGALAETDPEHAVAGPRSGRRNGSPRPGDGVGEPEDLAVFQNRLRRLKESPELLRAYLEVLQEVWEPIDDMWQEALPVIEEAGRHVVAQYEGGRSLEITHNAGV